MRHFGDVLSDTLYNAALYLAAAITIAALTAMMGLVLAVFWAIMLAPVLLAALTHWGFGLVGIDTLFVGHVVIWYVIFLSLGVYRGIIEHTKTTTSKKAAPKMSIVDDAKARGFRNLN